MGQEGPQRREQLGVVAGVVVGQGRDGAVAQLLELGTVAQQDADEQAVGLVVAVGWRVLGSAELDQELGLAGSPRAGAPGRAAARRRRPSSRRRAVWRRDRQAHPPPERHTATRRPGRSSATSAAVAVGGRPRVRRAADRTERDTPGREVHAEPPRPGQQSGQVIRGSRRHLGDERRARLGTGCVLDQRGDRRRRRGRLQPCPPFRRGALRRRRRRSPPPARRSPARLAIGRASLPADPRGGDRACVGERARR